MGRPAMAAGALGVVLVALALGGCGSSGTTVSTQGATVAPARATTAAATTTAVSTTAAAPARPRPRIRRTAPVRHHAAPPAHPAPAPASATPHPQAATPRPAAKRVRPPGPLARPIDETAQLVLVSSPGPGRYEQQGTVTGTFDGTMTLNARVTEAGVVVDFTADVTGGTVTGHGLAIPTIDSRSPVATLKGTAVITGGTGMFAHVRSSKLTVRGTAVLPSGAKATVHLTGTVTY